MKKIINKYLIIALVLNFYVVSCMFFTNTVAAQNSTFVARKTSIGMSGNKWWYSSLNPFYPTYGLPNCTAYAYGRLLEINNGVKVGLPTGPAGKWYERTTTIEKTEALEPKLGAVICFESLTGGAGHVAVVEDILPNGNIICSNSAYGKPKLYFYMTEYSKANGYNDGDYKFQGFIYANLNSENYFDSGRYVSGDFNGDGKDDIATMYDYGNGKMSLLVFSSTGSSFNTWEQWYSVPSNEIYLANNVTGRMVSGDFNGDGKDDIATMYDYGKGRMSLHVFLSTGSSFSTCNTWYSAPSNEIYLAENVTGRMVAGDFNGDGKADISTMYDYGNGSMKLLNFMSRGNSFTSWKPWYGVPTGQYYVDKIMGKIIVREY